MRSFSGGIRFEKGLHWEKYRSPSRKDPFAVQRQIFFRALGMSNHQQDLSVNQFLDESDIPEKFTERNQLETPLQSTSEKNDLLLVTSSSGGVGWKFLSFPREPTENFTFQSHLRWPKTFQKKWLCPEILPRVSDGNFQRSHSQRIFEREIRFPEKSAIRSDGPVRMVAR